MDDLMFHEGELRLGLETQARGMVAVVEAEPEESLKQADTDEWAAALAQHFAVACPELHTAEVWMEEVKEVTVDVSRDQMRAIIDPDSEAVRKFPGYRIVVHVPFDGEEDVFTLRPNEFTLNPPHGRVEGSELVLTIDYPYDTQPDIDARVQGFVDTVSRWLGFARADIDSFNRGLEQQAREAIAARRQRIEQRDAHLARSKISVRRSGESGKKTFLADVLVRRTSPRLAKTPADDKPPRLEPVLSTSASSSMFSESSASSACTSSRTHAPTCRWARKTGATSSSRP